MKHTIHKTVLLIGAALLLLLHSCAAPAESNLSQETTTNQETAEEEKSMNILQDAAFEKGFDLLGMDSAADGATVYKRIRYGGEGDAVWKIAQWWSKYNLKEGDESVTEEQYRLSDPSKSVTVDRAAHTVTLALNAGEEFDGWQQNAPSKWPHLLVEQSVTGNSAIGAAESVTAKLAFTVNQSRDLRDSGGRGLHAQFAWFIYIVDTNPESDGYGNFLWFGLNIFSPPGRFTSAYSSQDTAGGPGNFIYSLSSREFLNEVVEPGKDFSFSIDILPHVTKALKIAKKNGFMIGTEVEDCSITGTNIGWEIFDRWDESITIREIGIFIE